MYFTYFNICFAAVAFSFLSFPFDVWETFSHGAVCFPISFKLPWRTLFRFFFFVTFSELFLISFMLCFKFSSLLFHTWELISYPACVHRFLLQPQTGVYHAIQLLIVHFKQWLCPLQFEIKILKIKGYQLAKATFEVPWRLWFSFYFCGPRISLYSGLCSFITTKRRSSFIYQNHSHLDKKEIFFVSDVTVLQLFNDLISYRLITCLLLDPC